MARITKAGTGGAVRVAVAGTSTFETIAELRSWSVEESADTVEDTNMGSSGIRSYKTTHKTWSGTADVYIAYDDTTGEIENFTEIAEASSTVPQVTIGTSYDFQFYADDTNTSNNEKYAGTGIVTGISRSVAHDGMAEMSVTIQGNSALS